MPVVSFVSRTQHGAQPRTEWLGGLIERDERGFILSGPDLLRGGKRPPSWTLDRDPGELDARLDTEFAEDVAKMDTGGYRHSPPEKELYIRWFQQTALSTVMQVGDSSSQPPWVFTGKSGTGASSG